MKSALKISGFTIVVVLFYSYVGQMVPQQRTDPPETTELSADMTTEEIVQIGQEIVRGKGTCLTCHGMAGEEGGRFPDLANIGAVAGERRDGYDDVEYLAESLYEPNAYVVEGYNPAMPQVNTPPIDLTDQEIKAVIAYLQSLGGTPTITMDTQLAYASEEGASEATAGEASAAAGSTMPAEQASTASASLDGEALYTEYLCNTCHSIDSPQQLVGPSLYDVGSRMTRAEIYESIMEPDATVREGFPPGTMTATLKGIGFYQNVTAQELQTIVDFLASQTGE